MINNNTPGVKHRVSRVSDGFAFGLYAWRMPDGKILGDKEGNVLNVASLRGDIKNMAAIRQYVNKELGIFAGEPYFLEGAAQLTEDEHDGQMEQMMNGEVPSYDLGSLKDDMRRSK